MSASVVGWHAPEAKVWQLLQEPEWKVAEEDCKEAYAITLQQESNGIQPSKDAKHTML